jgi:ABC-type transport system involved in cytochrome bd biosynthesis fused ATPase/permease subunit
MVNYKLSDLQNEVFNLLIEEKLINKLIFYNMITMILDLIINNILYKISNGNLQLRYLYIFTDISNHIFNIYIINNMNNSISIVIKKKFIKKALEQYNRLSFDSKNKVPVDIFYLKMNSACDSIATMISWGFPTLMNLIGAFLQCILIFYYKKLIFMLCFIIGINVIVYYKYIQIRRQKYYSDTKLTREKVDRIKSKLHLSLPLFAQGEKTSDFILDHIIDIELKWIDTNQLWNHIMLITKIVNKCGIVLISIRFNGSVASYMLLIRVIGNFNSAISSLSSFLNQNNRHETDFNSYQLLFSDIVYKDKPINKQLNSLNIINCKISHGGFNMRFDTGGLIINIGDKILIKGRSGHGKSTFINALMGKIDGLILDKYQLENYSHVFVEFYQNIREKLPTSAISIRELFENEPNNSLIMKCLNTCFPDGDITKILYNISLAQNNKIIDSLDIDINEKLSGGEKTRLALATRIYQMLVKQNKSILILDEPEQGSDPEVAIQIINNIFELFKDKTIIMISHICDCNLNKLNIKWNKKINIHEGVIYNTEEEYLFL